MKIIITSIVDLERSLPNRIHHFIEGLSKDHEITVISIKDNWKIGNNVTLDQQRIFNDKVKIIYPFDKIKSPIIQEIYSFFYLKKFLSKLELNKYDVHLNYNSLVMGYKISCFLKGYQIQTIYDIADDLPQMVSNSPQIPIFIRPLARYFSKWLLHRNIKISSKVTTTCQSLVTDLRLPIKKTVVLPNGVSPHFFQKHRTSKYNDKILKVCYVGALREWVDFEIVFRSIYRSPLKIELYIIGREGNYEDIVSLSKRMKIKNSVIFCGSKSYNQIPSILKNMDVCILPFKKNKISENAFPLKILEYAASTIPIISSSLPEVKKIMDNNILYADSIEEWTYAFGVMFENYQDYASLILKKQDQLKQYDWKIITKSLTGELVNVSSQKKTSSSFGDKA